MAVKVSTQQPEDASEEVTVAAPPAPRKATPLFDLKAQRAKLVEHLYIDLKVPRYEAAGLSPYVRYSPINSSEFLAAIEKRQKTNSKEATLLANADILVQSCLGVYGVLDEDSDTKYSFRPGDENGPWTRFDPDLAIALGLPHDAGAIPVIRALYLTDGDLLAAAQQVFEFSGMSNEQADKDF